MAALPSVIVHYSRRGRELFWCGSASRDASDGPAAARQLLTEFCEAAQRSFDSTRLYVVPARPGGAQVEVKPVLGESLAAFLDHACSNDHGAFQLRVEFLVASEADSVLIKVVFPGCTSTAGATDESSLMTEQFECKGISTVSTLKRLLHLRTGFPVNQLILLLGHRRLHDGFAMARVVSAVDSMGVSCQCHLAASGAYVFVRQEGQGHRTPCGSCTAKLYLPEVVQGARVRSVAFDLEQTLDDFRLSVQAVSGLPPATLELAFANAEQAECASGRIAMAMQDGKKTLAFLGFVDGCSLHVSSSGARGVLTKSYDIPLDVPTAGSSSLLYEHVAQRFGIADASSIALFSGITLIGQETDLGSSNLADGCVLAAYIKYSLQIPFSVFVNSCAGSKCRTLSDSSDSSQLTSSTASTSLAGSSSGRVISVPESMQPTSVSCLSTDTVKEVRERISRSVARKNTEHAMQISGSKVFVADASAWNTSGLTCSSLGELATLTGNFVPCSDNARLSRLGIVEGVAHLVLIPEQTILVEVDVRVAGDSVGTRKLSIAGTLRLASLGNILQRELQDHPPAGRTLLSCNGIEWSLGSSKAGIYQQDVRGAGSSAATASAYRGSVMAVVSSAAASFTAKGKRKLLDGGEPDSLGNSKKRRSTMSAQMLCPNDFVSDVYTAHCHAATELPPQFLCPISLDVMRDPVVVCGSGNTYDRKSIERHLQMKHTDPITNIELRRASERRLVPNNYLRSQVAEAERSRIDLHLIAFLPEQSLGSSSRCGSMGSYLRRLSSVFRKPA